MLNSRRNPQRNIRKRGHAVIYSQLVLLLQASSLTLQLTTVAKTGSTYCHFPDLPEMGKLRIGDHNERRNLGYRWQLRVDRTGSWVDTQKGHKRFFYGIDKVEDLAKHLIRYANAINRRLNQPAQCDLQYPDRAPGSGSEVGAAKPQVHEVVGHLDGGDRGDVRGFFGCAIRESSRWG